MVQGFPRIYLNVYHIVGMFVYEGINELGQGVSSKCCTFPLALSLCYFTKCSLCVCQNCWLLVIQLELAQAKGGLIDSCNQTWGRPGAAGLRES